ncbi:MAG: glycosyltransferase, partial [Halobacteriovoraceae bacterium]|nr:glycosyltransferase [Halobacteriovoraceae bacterium]
MSQGLKVSVIIPTFNRAHTLERAINSVKAQTFKQFELIIVDDGSTDNTAKLLKQYKDIKIITQDNMGVSHARNSAIAQAQGQYISFLDSDDEWLPHKLEAQLQLLDSTNVKWVHGEEIWIRNGVRVNQMKKHKKGGGNQFIPSLERCMISPSTVIIEKKILEKAGCFRDDYPVCEDYDLWLKLTASHEIGFVSDPVIIKYGGHSDQLSSKFYAMDYWRVKSLDWVLANNKLSSEQR